MQEEMIQAFVEPLNRADVPYMVTGSVAVIVMAEPRLTHDVDIVIQLRRDDCLILPRLFDDQHYYCPPLEVLQLEAARENRGHFNVIHLNSGGKADFYPIGKDPLHLWAIKQRTAVEYRGIKLFVAPPEYVILRKLQFYAEGGSAKHIQDIANLQRFAGSMIDKSLLQQWIDRLQLQQQWLEVEKECE